MTVSSGDYTATTYIAAARHGERIDYVLRDARSNWLTLPDTERPWDPPLTDHGRTEQAVGLGRRLRKALSDRGLPPVTAVYSSPLIRCCQTAAGAIRGLEGQCPLQIRVEHGLVEDLNENWYRSWSLPGSDGTWGYRLAAENGDDGENTPSSTPPLWHVDVETIHPRSRAPVQGLLRSAGEIAEVFAKDGEHDIIDISHTEMCHPILEPYRWGHFESRRSQKNRMKAVASALADRHPGESILLLSHGGPVTHLYEELTGKGWSEHGVAGFASFSIYSAMATQEDGEREERRRGDGSGQDGAGKERLWKEVVINDCTHVIQKGSGEYQSGQD